MWVLGERPGCQVGGARAAREREHAFKRSPAAPADGRRVPTSTTSPLRLRACPPADPAAFCRELVTYIYQQQQQQQQAGAGAGAGEADEEGRRRRRAHLLQALRALRLVLEASPRLLGLLATKPAVDPLLECLRPACAAGLAVPLPHGPAAGERAAQAAAALAAAAPPWAAGGGGAPPGSPAADELEAAELALMVLLRLTAHSGCLEALTQDKCVAWGEQRGVRWRARLHRLRPPAGACSPACKPAHLPLLLPPLLST